MTDICLSLSMACVCVSVCSGQLHIFASNTAHPTINDYSHEIEFANVVRVRLNNFTQC